MTDNLSPIEAEHAVLGALLMRPEMFQAVRAVLGDDGGFFSAPRHAEMYEAMIRVHRAGKTLDERAVWLELGGQDRRPDWASFMGRLTDVVLEAGGSQYAVPYALAVRAAARRRQGGEQ